MAFQPTRPTHRLISAQVRMPQISGLKWKDQTLHDLDVFRERKLKMTKKDDLEEFGDIGSSSAASLNIDRALIAKFLREECVVTGHNQIDQIQTFDRDEGRGRPQGHCCWTLFEVLRLDLRAESGRAVGE